MKYHTFVALGIILSGNRVFSKLQILPGESTWHDGVKMCERIGMEMLIIDHPDVIADTSLSSLVSDTSQGLWIGLSWNSTSYQFYWVNNIQLGSYSPWLNETNMPDVDKEPNCMTSKCNCVYNYCGQDCVRITRANGVLVWMTTTCTKLLPVLCYSDDVSSTPPTTIFTDSTQASTASVQLSADNVPIIRGTDRYTEPTENVETTERYREPTENVETTDRYQEQTKNVDTTYRYTEPTENVETTDRYREQTENIDTTDRYTEPTENVETTERYREPTENVDTTYRYTEPTENVRTTERYREQTENVDTTDRYTEPTENVETTDRYREQTENVNTSYMYTEPTENVRTTERYREQTENVDTTEQAEDVNLQIRCLNMCDCDSIGSIRNSAIRPKSDFLYTVDKKKTGAFKRRHHSAHDDRLSARVIGCLGAVVIIVVFSFIICLDTSSLLLQGQLFRKTTRADKTLGNI